MFPGKARERGDIFSVLQNLTATVYFQFQYLLPRTSRDVLHEVCVTLAQHNVLICETLTDWSGWRAKETELYIPEIELRNMCLLVQRSHRSA